MLTVTLEDDVVAGLQKYAIPMVDDTNSVIRKVLRQLESFASHAGNGNGHTPSAATVLRRKSKRERTLHALLRKGILAPGIRLALDQRQVHGALPVPLKDSKLRCSVGPVPRARQNVIWDFDGNSYSLSALTEKLRDSHGIPLTGGALNGYDFWCLESSPGKSLWTMAEENGRS